MRFGIRSTISFLLKVQVRRLVRMYRLPIDIDTEWVSLPALDTVMKIVARVSNRVFVGLPLCNIQYLLQF